MNEGRRYWGLCGIVLITENLVVSGRQIRRKYLTNIVRNTNLQKKKKQKKVGIVRIKIFKLKVMFNIEFN